MHTIVSAVLTVPGDGKLLERFRDELHPTVGFRLVQSVRFNKKRYIEGLHQKVSTREFKPESPHQSPLSFH